MALQMGLVFQDILKMEITKLGARKAASVEKKNVERSTKKPRSSKGGAKGPNVALFRETYLL
eukprot:459899-Pyramimonas_sp.AAC.1